MNLSEIWARLTSAHLTCAAFAEAGAVLGDEGGVLTFVARSGEALAEVPVPEPVYDVASSRDDTLVAAVSGEGELTLLVNRRVAFQMSLGLALRKVLVEPKGDYVLAIADDGETVFVNRFGREMRRIRIPGPLQSAAMIPATGQIVATTRTGLVQSFNSWGKPLWQTQLMHATGSVSTDDEGGLILVPTMAYGVEAFTAKGEGIGAYDVGEPVKAAGCSGAGDLLLLATTQDRLVLMKNDARVLTAEVFPAPISDVALSRDGRHALLVTTSGYAHLLALAERSANPMLEFEDKVTTGRTHYLLKKRVYSPYSMMRQARLAFSPDGQTLVAAGDRRRVEVMDLEGNSVGLRRYAGFLHEIGVAEDGRVRVYASQSVFSFVPGEDGTRPEWTGASEFAQVAMAPDASAVAVTEDGEVVRFLPEGGLPKSITRLPGHSLAGLMVVGDTFAAAINSSDVVVCREDGEQLARSGPWPLEPKLLAASDLGYLFGVGKLLVLIGTDGEERWREHLPAAARAGVALPGVFLVVDAAGVVHTVTAGGKIRKAFAGAHGLVVPFGDAGEGPGLLVTHDGLITAVHPGGEPRWRFRAEDQVAFLRPSPDNRLVGVIAGLDLILLPLVPDLDAVYAEQDRSAYLEFGNG